MADRGELETWCASYIEAFNTGDADQVAAHWSFPALIFQAGGRIVFDSEDRFSRNTKALLGFYERQQVACAERRLVDVMAMSETGAAITVADRMLDPSGAPIVSWRAAYVLQRLEKDWRATVAFADGELAAWAARGTPLGRG